MPFGKLRAGGVQWDGNGWDGYGQSVPVLCVHAQA
jgi:hypothetical protein